MLTNNWPKCVICNADYVKNVGGNHCCENHVQLVKNILLNALARVNTQISNSGL